MNPYPFHLAPASYLLKRVLGKRNPQTLKRLWNLAKEVWEKNDKNLLRKILLS